MHFNDELLRWGEKTQLSFNGTVFNPTEIERLRYTMPNVTMRSTRADALLFVDEDSLGLRLPDDFTIVLSAEGDLQGAKGEVTLRSTQGDVLIEGSIDLAQEIVFDIDASTTDFQLAELLQNEQLGPLSMNIKSKGRGTDPRTLDAELQCLVSSFQFNGYPIKDLELNGQLKEGKGDLDSHYKDEQLNATLTGTIDLDSITPRYTLDLDVIGADLEALGLTTKPDSHLHADSR